MERIIVTGANGFIGRYVTECLLNNSYFVFAIDCSSHQWDSENIEQIVSRISSGKTINYCSEKVGQAEIMIHLAADITVPGDSLTLGNNLDGMFAALEIARRVKVKQFILLSSVPVIGEIQYTPIDEVHPVRPKTPYHWSKYLCEQMLGNYGEIFETITIIRIPSPIGVGMRKNVFLSVLLDKMQRNEDVNIYGSGNRVQSYIDVRDLSVAIHKAIEAKANGLFLISGKEAISNRQLAELCKDLIKGKSNLLYNRQKDPSESEKWIISHKKAEDIFGYQPLFDIEDTIRWIIR